MKRKPNFDNLRKRIVSEFPEKFWKKIQIKSQDDCWLWVGGYREKFGYGRVCKLGVMYLSHRVAWELTNGPIPDGIDACHKCDNPPCCNPSHLFLGTAKDNIRDCAEKGRLNTPKGEKQGNHKLTDRTVKEIRNLYPIVKSTRKLAKKFGVDRRAIMFVLKGKTWKHV